MKLFGRSITYGDYPPPVFETVPAMVPCRPAMFDPDHLSRVTCCAFGQSVPSLVEVMTARQYRETPLATYPIGEATVLGGTLITKGLPIFQSEMVTAKLSDVLADSPVLNDAVLANSMQGMRYFGHWLSDDASAFEAFRDHPELVSLPLQPWGDARLYARLFDQQWQQHMVIRSRSLTLVRDLGFSRRKAERYRQLRGRMRKQLGASDNAGRVVFLKRGPSGDPREIVNSAELEARLSAAGVKIVMAEGASEDFLRSMLDASIIITIEGSQDRHALYALREGGGMVTLLPPDRFYVATHEWVRNLDMHSGMIIGTLAEGGFTIDPDEVLQMVDRLLPLTENREAS
jgi:hypothetical protein